MNRILRYTLHERIVHWIAGFAFVYLLLSGLAFWSPILYWLTYPLGGGQSARAWHPWAGLLFTAVCIWMRRIWRSDMRVTAQDREWQKSIAKYVCNEDHHLPPAGRFNAGQKYFFWLMFWGGFLLLASGLVLWLPERIPWRFAALREWAVLIHAVSALATIGGFIIHIYMGTAVVRGGFTSIVRGEVSREWARTHHPLWLREKE